MQAERWRDSGAQWGLRERASICDQRRQTVKWPPATVYRRWDLLLTEQTYGTIRIHICTHHRLDRPKNEWENYRLPAR